uniref:HTH CENPB-type domain-containing protein n=1 Tax=Bionectria ochroleuca TaxID=29856 RepID=A0A8H7NAS1_BIOOC
MKRILQQSKRRLVLALVSREARFRKYCGKRSTISNASKNRSPPRQREARGKHPDFDRTLSNYVRRQQEGGFEIKDEEIMDQAKLFARASGHQDSLVSSLTSSWLQKFKQKHGITSGRLMRRASETNIPDSARMSTSRSKKKKEKSDIISPTSPSGQKSPLSDSRSDEDQQHDGFDFSAFSYRQAASQSATSLSSNLRDAGNNSSFSSSAMSPTGTLTFSPDPNTGAFAVDQTLQSQMADIRTSSITPSSDLQPREKRSNTFPSLNLDLVNQVVSSEPMTPRHQIPSTAPSSAIESPVHDFNSAPFGIDSTLTSPPQLHRSSSNSSMTGRSTPITNGTMPAASIDSSPVSPSQEDACRAATTLLSYIQSSMKTNGQFEHSELMTLVQLTNKLQVHQYQSLRPAMGASPESPRVTARCLQQTMK